MFQVRKAKFSEELYLFYKDQGYLENENNISYDNTYELGFDSNTCDFDFEYGDSDDTDYA